MEGLGLGLGGVTAVCGIPARWGSKRGERGREGDGDGDGDGVFTSGKSIRRAQRVAGISVF